MSAKSKSQSKERRKKLKSERKAAERAKYEAFAASGNNGKRARARLGNKATVRTGRHASGSDCGNVGCERCTPPTGKSFPLGHRGWRQALNHGLMEQFMRSQRASNMKGQHRHHEQNQTSP